jgi:hypothetical protein
MPIKDDRLSEEAKKRGIKSKRAEAKKSQQEPKKKHGAAASSQEGLMRR